MGRIGDLIRKKAKQMGRAVTSAVGAKKDFDAEKTSKKTLAAVKERAEQTANNAFEEQAEGNWTRSNDRRLKVVERAERAMTTNEAARQKLETEKLMNKGATRTSFSKK